MPATATRSRWRRRLLRAVVGVVVLVLVVAAGLLVWLLNPSEADEDDLAAVVDDPDLAVSREEGFVLLAPAGGVGDEAVVFYPGAHTEPDAYLATWAGVVEATGVAVLVPEMPLGLAFLDEDVTERLVATQPGVDRWWLGGHSMGGIAATSYLAEHPESRYQGLVLWAAFADDGVDLSARDDLSALSVTGSADDVVATADVEERLDLLPAATTAVEIDGMEHGQFGAYDSFFGDGEPAVADAAARAELTRVTSGFLSDR